MFPAVEDDVLVGLIRQDEDPPLLGDLRQRLQLRLVEHGARGVAGGVEDHHLGLVGDRLADIGRVELEAVLLPHRRPDRDPAEKPDLGVIVVSRIDDDDLLARRHQVEHGVEDHLHGAHGHEDLRGRIGRDAVFGFQLVGDGVPQVPEALGRRVAGETFVQGRLGGVPDVDRRVEIGLADSQVDHAVDLVGHGEHDADARPFHLVGPGGHLVLQIHEIRLLTPSPAAPGPRDPWPMSSSPGRGAP